MKNTVTIQQQVVSPTKIFDFSRYCLTVAGDPSKGQRFARIMVPIADESRRIVSSCEVTVSGAEFNEFWAGFGSEKQIVELVMKKLDLSASDVVVDDSILNS